MFIIYVVLGIFLVDGLINKTRTLVKIWLGSVLGVVAFMWSNIPFSFFFGFSFASHIAGLVLFTGIVFAACLIGRHFNKERQPFFKGFKLSRDEKTMLITLIPFMLIAFHMLYTHTLYEYQGSIWTGQCTYGDMNMHLGFITSIANQGMFPPTYSILPGELLKYPFLCDTVSSSLYLFGTNLKVAYIAPMFLAFLQVYTGFWMLAQSVLQRISKTLTDRKSTRLNSSH